MSYTTVSIPFGSGADTKTDPKMVAPPKLTLLQDCIFTNPKRLTKRNGYASLTNSIVGGGTWSSPTMTKSYNGELLLAATSSLGTGQRLFSYSEDLDGWVDKGRYISIATSKQIVNAGNTASSTAAASALTLGPVNTSSVTLGNITVVAYDIGYATSGATYITVIDQDTGTHLVDMLPVTGSIGWSRIVSFEANTFSIFYIESGGTLASREVSITEGGGVTLALAKTYGTCSTGDSIYPYNYDVIPNSAGGGILVMAQEASSRINIFSLSSSGTGTSEATISTTGHILPLSCNQDSSGNIWIYWLQNTDALQYAIYSSSFSSVLASTNIDTAGGLSSIVQLCGLSTSSTTQTLYLSFRVQDGGWIGQYYQGISQVSVNSSGTAGSITVAISGIEIYSKPIIVNSRIYLACATLSANDSTGFLMDMGDATNPVPAVAAKFLQGSCDGIFGNPQGVSDGGGETTDAEALSLRYPGFLTNLYALSSNQYVLGCGYVVELIVQPVAPASSTFLYPAETTFQVYVGSSLIIFDFDNIDAYQGLVQQNTLALNGGIVYQYDSQLSAELGFNADPDGVTGSVTTTGGSLGPGDTAAVYGYYIVYQWVDGLGNLHQSAPSEAVFAIISGTTNQVTISVNPCTLTQKQNVQVNLYRTIANGTIAYLIATTITNGPQAAIANQISFTDTGFNTADSEIVLYPQIYTEGDAILSNVAPPPSMILWQNQNRLWCVDSENPETTIEYCKTASPGTGISFSTGLGLDLIIDSHGGAIRGASRMDEKTVILKQSAVGYFYGDGNNDAGTGSNITPIQFIPSETGCSNSKSVLLYPGGVIFRASSNKGIYLLSRGLQVEYFGMDVEAYNSQDIQSAKFVPTRNQIRFLTSSGDSILYDYVMNQWGVFTNHEGYSADYFQGAYVYVRTDGSVYQEDFTGQYLDGSTSYAPLIQLYWLKAQTTQGFERVRRAMLLGDFQIANGGHGVQISAAYDFGTTFSTPVPYIFSGSNAAYQYRERFPRQKCDAIQLRIQEIVTGAAGEFIDFSDLGIEILPKQGLNKLPASQTVG